MVKLVVALVVVLQAGAALAVYPAPPEPQRPLLDLGHTADVTALALGPDGTRLASGSRDGTVRLFDARTGHVQAEMRVASRVFAVAWSPDGRTLAVASTYNLVTLWDARAATKRATFLDHSMWVTDVAFSPDGKLIAGVDHKAGVIVREVSGGMIKARLGGDDLERVFWRPDGRMLVAFGRGHIRTWDAAIWSTPAGSYVPAPERDARPPELDAVADVAWGRNGGEVAVSARELTLRDLAGTPRATLAHGPSKAIAWSPDGRRLALGGAGGAVDVVDPVTGRVLIRLDAGTAPITALAWRRDGTELNVGNERGAISSWTVATGARRFEVPPQVTAVYGVAWSAGDRLAMVAPGGRGALWDLAKGVVIAQLEGPVTTVAWCGPTLFGMGDGRVRWWDGRTGVAVATATSLTQSSAVACAPDGKTAVLFGDGVELWDMERHTGRVLDWNVWAAAWAPDGRLAVSFENRVELWRLTGGKPIRLARRAEGSRVLAFSPDGKLLAAEHRTRPSKYGFRAVELVGLRATDLAPRGTLADCSEDSATICEFGPVVWRPDGTLLAAAVAGHLSIADRRPAAERVRAPLRIGNQASGYPAWSPDGRVLAVSNGDGVVLIRAGDGATLWLESVVEHDRLLFLAYDEQGRFAGDEGAAARVVPVPMIGGTAIPARVPMLTADFLGR